MEELGEIARVDVNTEKPGDWQRESLGVSEAVLGGGVGWGGG